MKTLLIVVALALASAVRADTFSVTAQMQGQGLTIRWPSESNQWFRVLTTDTAREPIVEVSPPIVASNSSSSVTIPIDHSRPSRFIRVMREEQGGAEIITKGSPLYVQDSNTWAATVRPEAESNPVQSFVLLDITDEEPVVIDAAFGTNITEALFNVDTAYLPNGPRQIAVVATEGDSDNPREYWSTPTTIWVTNALYSAPNSPRAAGWKLVIQFGSIVKSADYTYVVRISTMENGVSNYFASATGTMDEADQDGIITVEDTYVWDDSLQDYRMRDPYDSYPGVDSFDVEITVNRTAVAARGGFEPPTVPTGPPWSRRYRMIPVLPIQFRISSVVEDRNALHYNDESLDRTALSAMMDTWFLGLAYISWHWDFVRGFLDGNQSPSAEGWTILRGTADWTKYNYALARRRSPTVYPTVYAVTHLYSFTHGNPSGLHANARGAGLGFEVTPTTLTALGFAKTNGLRFLFLDACSTFKNGAALPTLLLQNGGVTGHVSYEDFLTKGIPINYGCGYTKDKLIGFASHVYLDHLTYSSQFVQYLIDPDPGSGYPRWTYAEARARARLLPGSGSVNPAAGNWDWIGCDALKIWW